MTETAPGIFEPAYYERLYSVENGHWWARGMRQALDAMLAPALGTATIVRALDAGCGTGIILDILARYPVSGPIVGFDLSAHALRFCQGRGAQDLARASAVTPPFASASFDLILCLDTLQHLAPAGADAKAMQAFARLLRPGGQLYIRTNSALGHRPLIGVDPNQYRRYDRSGLIALATRAGLIVERASYLNGIPGLWAALLERLRPPALAPPAGPRLEIRAPDDSWRSRLMGAVLAAESALIRRGVDLPFGHSLALLARRPK